MNFSITQAREWREDLQRGRSELEQSYQAHPDASALLRRHTELVDVALKRIWQELNIPKTLAFVALGGYGRKQLFPYSDVDLLLLLPKGSEEQIKQPIEMLIGLLWDIGLEVGHSVRTVEECLEQAQTDITVQTNLLEARLLLGDKKLFNEFSKRFTAQLDPKLFFEAKLFEQQQRHIRFHNTAYNLEPNLKEGPGGLRDLQNILWMARAARLGNSWNALLKQSLINASENRQLLRDETLLTDFRIRLHYLAKRREDRLLFDYQAQLAQQLGLENNAARTASEQLMQQYYRTAKSVNLINEILLQNLRALVLPTPTPEAVSLNLRFQARGNLLEAKDLTLFEKQPSAIFECFLTLQRNPGLTGINVDTLRAMLRARNRINQSFRKDPQNRQRFMEILREPRGIVHTLRRMNQYGILGRYIEQFGRIVGQMQHDLFHVYTVDEHILFVVRNIRRFTIPEYAHEFPLCSRLISGFERVELLYLAGLFHDIAKGRGGDHSELGKTDAYNFCVDHALDAEDSELVSWLVENHLMMSATAQKQDLGDPEVIEAFARRVNNMRRLTALYLITVADIRGTSPKVWNAWKAKLLEDLFYATQRYFSGTSPIRDANMQARQIEALRLLRENIIEEADYRDLWKHFDEGYFLRHEAQEIAWHTRLLYQQPDSQKPIVKARLSPKGEGIQVMIYTPDQNDLFARICSFFEHIHYNIVEAKIHTTRHNYALDSFIVLDEADRNAHYRDLLTYIEYELTQLLAQPDKQLRRVEKRLSRQLKHFPISPEVTITPDERGAYHVLSIVAGDRPGLLSRVAEIFVKYRIHLHTAKINTLGERAEDTFLITADHDQLSNPRFTVNVETELLEQLKT